MNICWSVLHSLHCQSTRFKVQNDVCSSYCAMVLGTSTFTVNWFGFLQAISAKVNVNNIFNGFKCDCSLLFKVY